MDYDAEHKSKLWFFIPHRSLALWLVHRRYTPKCVYACTVSHFDILNLWYSHESHVAHWSATSNSVWEQQEISFRLCAHTPLRKTSLKDKQISIPSSCFCLSIPHLPLCCHAWGWISVCVCVTDSPIDADVCAQRLSFWTPFDHCLSQYCGSHTYTSVPILHPLCMHAYTLQRDSVRWSNIDKLINSVLLSSCEEELNLFCFTDLTVDSAPVVCALVCGECHMLKLFITLR